MNHSENWGQIPIQDEALLGARGAGTKLGSDPTFRGPLAKTFQYLVFAIVFIAACAINTPAMAQSGLENLEQFIKTVKTGQADFTQVVTAPQREGQTARTKTSSGTFEFSRPNRFKFAYKKPFEQLIVADGQTLWLHDLDLNQVTQRKQSAVLANTPAALIASAADISALKADFNLENAPDKEGLSWVQATPRAKDGQLQSVRVGFKPAGNAPELAVLEILDSFGQRSVLKFSNLRTNAPLAAQAFQFTPPPKADVLRQ
jgi:outer membrane lipoprotein carrier protein